MVQVLFVQGGGEGTHDEWDSKLVASLERGLGQGYEVLYPRMPDEAEPSFAGWSAALERQIAALEGGAILVGHSMGGTVLVHAAAQQPRLLRHIAAVGLIAAPFVGAGGWPSDEINVEGNWAAPLAGIAVWLYQGDADDTTPMAHAELYAKAMPWARLRRLRGRDHQVNDDLSEVAEDIRGLAGPVGNERGPHST